jgi:uncharacterized protein YdhG (YjbR/CyaY superfamily)
LAKTRFTSVSEYIASKPKDARAALEQVRNAIRRGIPGAEEGLGYQMPVYTLNGVTALYFAGWKAHFSLYPVGDAIAAHFERELAGYERTKGGLKVPNMGGWSALSGSVSVPESWLSPESKVTS